MIILEDTFFYGNASDEENLGLGCISLFFCLPIIILYLIKGICWLIIDSINKKRELLLSQKEEQEQEARKAKRDEEKAKKELENSIKNVFEVPISKTPTAKKIDKCDNTPRSRIWFDKKTGKLV